MKHSLSLLSWTQSSVGSLSLSGAEHCIKLILPFANYIVIVDKANINTGDPRRASFLELLDRGGIKDTNHFHNWEPRRNMASLCMPLLRASHGPGTWKCQVQSSRLASVGQVDKDWKEEALSLVQLPPQFGWDPRGLRSVLWGSEYGKGKAGNGVTFMVFYLLECTDQWAKAWRIGKVWGRLGSHTDAEISKTMCLAQRLAHSRHYVGNSGMGGGTREFKKVARWQRALCSVLGPRWGGKVALGVLSKQYRGRNRQGEGHHLGTDWNVWVWLSGKYVLDKVGKCVWGAHELEYVCVCLGDWVGM